MPADPSAISRGFAVEVVTVLDVSPDGDWAEVANTSIGRRRRVTMNVQRTNERPDVGERWIIDRTLGSWTFAAIIYPTGDGRVYGVGGSFYG